MKLLVIADDLTGALDTGVRLGAKNTLVRIMEEAAPLDPVPEETQVLIIAAQTRHLSPEKAYERVFSIVSQAKKAGVACVYKKTDSALRGNIGAELAGARDALGKTMHFVPAFPCMNRVTRGGVHYIDGVPVNESVFGADPFEPVEFAAVGDIIARQAAPEGIEIHDAQTDEDIFRIARELKDKGELQLLSGCAGFAAALPEVLGLEREDNPPRVFGKGLLTVCGSINPITTRQLDAGESSGMARCRLGAEEKLSGQWREKIPLWLSALEEKGSLIIDCGDTYSQAEKARFEAKYGCLRTKIAQNMGMIAREMMLGGMESTMLITGGDTLLAFMAQLGIWEFTAIWELCPGIALCHIEYMGKKYALISKSGGFGERELLSHLAERLAKLCTGGM